MAEPGSVTVPGLDTEWLTAKLGDLNLAGAAGLFSANFQADTIPCGGETGTLLADDPTPCRIIYVQAHPENVGDITITKARDLQLVRAFGSDSEDRLNVAWLV